MQSKEEEIGYPVMEHFYTIQGEGKFSGKAAYFIRLGGCDVGCHWCDVKESWDASQYKKITAETMLSWVMDAKADFVVVTGGEPAMYDLTSITSLFRENGIKTAIETSGAYELKGEFDWVCFSPKKFKGPVDGIYPMADELKVVVFNQHDFKWAEEHAALVPSNCELYLQPEWDKSATVLEGMIDYVKKNPQWKMSLQTHKYMDIP